jgi:acetate kinase
VAHRAAAMLKRPLEELKLVSCHLGNGASLTAIRGGKSVDTTMGFTPLQGLAMGTRSGSVDPAIIKFIMDKEKMTIKEVDDYLNKKSGVLGISGISSDFRDLHAAADAGNERAALAIEIFCYRVKKYIGEYAAVLNGLDAVIFTAGIGENNDIVRRKVLEGLDYLGIAVDWDKNMIKGEEKDISTPNARVRTLVIPTNEELAIARETVKLLG